MCCMPSATTFWAPRTYFNDDEANCLIDEASIEGIVLPSRGSVHKVLRLIALLPIFCCFGYRCCKHDSPFNPLLWAAWRPVKLGLVLCSWFWLTLINNPPWGTKPPWYSWGEPWWTVAGVSHAMGVTSNINLLDDVVIAAELHGWWC
jgi:hypothetical protein